MECREAERLEDLSIDGEVSAHEQAELDAHLARCPACRDRAHHRRWFQSQLRAKLQTSSDTHECPTALQSRIRTQIRDERHARSVLWRRALPVSVALATVAVLSWARTAAPALDPEETVSRHVSRLPPEVRALGGERAVRRFIEQNLRYPVDLPHFRHPNVRLVGARLANIANEDSAHFMYDHRGARISVFAAPRPRDMELPDHFSERLVDGRTVMVGRHRGYNVVATERGELLYSFVSDVDDAELIELASALHR